MHVITVCSKMINSKLLRRYRSMVRKAVLEDVPRIAEIIVFGKRVAYRSIFKNDEVSFNELKVVNIAETYNNDTSLIENMIVYDDGIVKGLINRKYIDDDIEICEFYVEPFFKGQGIGRGLIQKVIDEAKKSNIQRIFLWVIENNLSARKFYETNGFIPNGDTCLIEGTEQIDMCYELRLR